MWGTENTVCCPWLSLRPQVKKCQVKCQVKRVMEGGRGLPRLVDFLSKSAILNQFIGLNRPIPTTGFPLFSPAFTGFLKAFARPKPRSVR